MKAFSYFPLCTYWTKLLTVIGLSFSNKSTSMSPKTVRNWARIPACALAITSRQKDTIRAGIRRIGHFKTMANYSKSAEFFNGRAEEAVVGDDAVAMLVIERFAEELAPGTFNDQTARGDVPEVNAGFRIGVEPA